MTNWIGRSEGAEVTFRCEDVDPAPIDYPVFTTRPDTLFGATFFVMAPRAPGRVPPGRRHSARARSTSTSTTPAPSPRSVGAADKPKTGVPLGGP